MNLNGPRGILQVNSANAPIQQIKAAGQTVRGATTQGLPLPVTNVNVSVTKTGDNRTLRVSFTQNPHDPYFTDADLYIQQGSNNPTLVAMGTSPIVVTVARSDSPSKVFVVSSGNWGSVPVSQSPGKAISLA